MDSRLAGLDALLLPTTAIAAPKMSEVAMPASFSENNMRLLRNPAIVNFFDLCAISLPIRATVRPVGLMLAARNGHDRRLFEIAAAVERLLSG
jgi:aspartyl-tRNA(Asn)/glutamyl-tRNA(Gln) amidotransferase subunit A